MPSNQLGWRELEFFINIMDSPQPTLGSNESDALVLLNTALELMTNKLVTKSRELSIAITQLETAMMWLNKDRANKGFIQPNKTHVKVN